MRAGAVGQRRGSGSQGRHPGGRARSPPGTSPHAAQSTSNGGCAPTAIDGPLCVPLASTPSRTSDHLLTWNTSVFHEKESNSKVRRSLVTSPSSPAPSRTDSLGPNVRPLPPAQSTLFPTVPHLQCLSSFSPVSTSHSLTWWVHAGPGASLSPHRASLLDHEHCRVRPTSQASSSPASELTPPGPSR